MGTVKEDGERAIEMAWSDEMIQEATRTVILSAFDIAATETTEAQCIKIDSGHRQQCAAGSTRPVVQIDWNEARAICQKAGGDLPTEAQWEYAARGGSRFPWSFGDNVELLKYYAWYADKPSQLQEVEQRRPNPLGLYDMHGNAWEWVRDWYDEYIPGVEVDPPGPASGKCSEGYIRVFNRDKSATCRVVRGGSFIDSPEVLRSARRVYFLTGAWFGLIGFRCVRVPPALGR